jgi:hypothetical protein
VVAHRLILGGTAVGAPLQAGRCYPVATRTGGSARRLLLARL